ncbi:MAG: hypothetical protein WCP06_09215 [Verrucomicrobiota bacterium]
MGKKSIHFELWRDENTGSSRLRGYALARELRNRGYHVSMACFPSPKLPEADIFVFQKVVPTLERLAELKSAGKRILFDIDDNYLLDDVGKKRDILSFINAVDLVVVGSNLLLETFQAYHDRVVLFENPLDILPQSLPKKLEPLSGSLGWVGNRSNLPSLEELGLLEKVTTITSGGDIEWSLSTVDQELVKFDAVLLPVIRTKWNYSKNANRLLKCVGLGVPFLASATPDNRVAVEQLGLDPHRFLVEESESWADKIAELRANYSEAFSAISKARTVAKKCYSIEAVAGVWIEAVFNEQPKASLELTPASKEWFKELDVVVLDEAEQSFLQHTLESLRISEVAYRSIQVVSPYDRRELKLPAAVRLPEPGDDFFEIYPRLCCSLGSGTGKRVLFIRAGAALARGFFLSAPQTTADLTYFTVQQETPALKCCPTPPIQVERLLMEPYEPFILLMSAEVVQKHLAGSERFGALGLWNFLIRAYTGSNLTPSHVSDPLVTAIPGALRGSVVDHYVQWWKKRASSVAKDLPNTRVEWLRLQKLWHGMVISANHELFAKYCAVILPLCFQKLAHAELQPKHEFDNLNEIHMIYQAFKAVDRSRTFTRLLGFCRVFSSSFAIKWKHLRRRVNQTHKRAKRYGDLT